MRSHRLSTFQQAAVDHIVARLEDPSGSRRFLLADEVGLGKTIVAREVVAELARRRAKGPLNVVYLCSNTEIAEQNRTKLVGSLKAEERAHRRVTELAFRASRARPKVRLFAFTPGTSLHSSTGVAWERKLLLYLLYSLFGFRGARWNEYLRCGVQEGSQRWTEETRISALRALGEGITAPFRMRVRQAWRELKPWDDETILQPKRDLPALVAQYNDYNAGLRSKKNAVVRALRKGLQEAALDAIAPDLVILDEVQRFRDILNVSDDAGSIERRLFTGQQGSRPRVLILSATPYRLYTIDRANGDDVSHYDDFLATLRFLFVGDRDADALETIKESLRSYRRRLEDGRFVREDDAELRSAKEKIEEQLKRVLCRTERNWYVQDARKGVDVIGLDADAEFAMPPQELAEYKQLREVAHRAIDSSQNLLEYWKSCPAVLTFMDHGYKVLRDLASNPNTQFAPELIATDNELATLPERSYRFRALLRAAFAAPRNDPRDKPWLWIRPSYFYYTDTFFEGAEPRKLLVFSSWRFVPKAVAILLSSEAKQRYRPDNESEHPSLRFVTSDGRLGFHSFDVLFPSPALARAVPLATWAKRGLDADGVFEEARRSVRALLERCGVEIRATKAASLWQVVAFVDAREPDGEVTRKLMAGLRLPAKHGGDSVGAFEPYRNRWNEWMRTKAPPQVTEAQIDRITEIALFSPAISLLRAFWSVVATPQRVLHGELLELCFTALRSYFNRPNVRGAINLHAKNLPDRIPHYTGRALRYCRDAHIQAVLDEYLFLTTEGVGDDKLETLCGTLSRLFGIVPGAPRTNGRKYRRGRAVLVRDAASYSTAYALAYGDEHSNANDGDEPSEAGATRKTAIREAFNSPFWPFVLATTSAGQEGLDFHLYCRDIVHWNLPWNPVDLEQREGRINRRNGLALRRSIAADWPLSRVANEIEERENAERDTNDDGDHAPVWQRVFEAVSGSDDPQKYKHGMSPHWVYECADPKQTSRIRRHLPFHPLSEDAARYARLREEVTLYRLVFGQPRQEDLLDHLRHEVEGHTDGDAIRRRLAGYMINLSPLPPDHARNLAELEATALLQSRDRVVRLKALLADVAELRARHGSALSKVDYELDALLGVVSAASGGGEPQVRHVQAALEALLYLRNPYDSIFDFSESGFQDDIDVIRSAYVSITGSVVRHRSPDSTTREPKVYPAEHNPILRTRFR